MLCSRNGNTNFVRVCGNREYPSGRYGRASEPETGETELKPVVRTFRNETTELVHVTVNGEEIVCTNEHPFYSPVKGWTAACQLRAGDKLPLVAH